MWRIETTWMYTRVMFTTKVYLKNLTTNQYVATRALENVFVKLNAVWIMFHYDPIMFVGDTLSILFCDTLSFCDTFSNLFFLRYTFKSFFAIHFQTFLRYIKKKRKKKTCIPVTDQLRYNKHLILISLITILTFLCLYYKW